ncbi:MAG: Tripartite-type tricarboxylate transporter, receptor component TctC [Betaproteobacteria bacterium]|nr:Tripartite-type tricarboxylate transporter, receptor component TctC [Betaproteobacteria bacterium]
MHPITSRSRRLLLRIAGVLQAGAALLLSAASFDAAPQSYPARPIRIVVPFAAGGTADVMGRLLSQKLGPMYGQQLIVDNRPGSGGHIGAEIAARAPADGYTIVIGTIGIHAAYSIYTRLPYEPAKQLQPIMVLAESPSVLVVHPTMPARTVKEFIALAKARPGEINFGSAGTGTSTHMTGELFKVMANVDLTHVPYKGSAPALTDLLGGQIHAMFENLPTLPGHVQAGRLRALGVTSKERSPALPNVPTVAEAGVPGYVATAWFSVAAPSKVPAEVIHKLNADINSVMSAPDLQPKLRDLGVTPIGGTREAAAKYFAIETDKWNRVIKTAGIRAD